MPNKPFFISMRLWLAIILILYSVASYFVERTIGGGWANINHALGIFALGWYLAAFYKEQREVLLTGFYQTYYFIGMLLSATLVSGGIYMIEVAEFGNQNGAFWILIIYFVAGLEANRQGYMKSGRLHLGMGVMKLSRGAGKLLIFPLIATVLSVAAYIFAKYQGPVLLGIDRVTFWREVAPSYLSFFPSLVVQSFFFVAFYFLWSQRDGRKSWLPMMALSAYILVGLFVLGQKFSLFILFITTWLAIFSGVYKNFNFKIRHGVLFVAIAASLVSIVLASYLSQDKEAVFALTRIALQAQLIWSVFNDAQAHNFWPANVYCYFGCQQFENGGEFISYQYLPTSTYNFYSEGGTILSGFMPALSIMTMGLAVSLLLHVTVSFILGAIQRKLVFAVSEKNIIYSFLLYKAHVGLTVIWFAAMQTAIPGLIVTLVLIGLYRLCFPVATSKGQLAKMYGAVRVAAT